MLKLFFNNFSRLGLNWLHGVSLKAGQLERPRWEDHPQGYSLCSV
jgi:hypothetical protein